MAFSWVGTHLIAYGSGIKNGTDLMVAVTTPDDRENGYAFALTLDGARSMVNSLQRAISLAETLLPVHDAWVEAQTAKAGEVSHG